MKTKPLTRLLLGAFLALPVCASGQYSLTVLSYAFNLTAVAGANRHVYTCTDPICSGSANAYSAVDQSIVSCAAAVTAGRGLFTGSGKVEQWTGSLGGLHSAQASGNTTIYVLIKTTGTWSYEFASKLEAKGDVYGQIMFNGLTNGLGTVTTYGNLPPGLHELKAGASTGNLETGGGATWTYTLSLRPLNIAPGKLTAAQKADFYAQYSATTALRFQLLSLGDSVPQAHGSVLFGAIALQQLENVFKQDFQDPPDTNYTVLAQAVAPAVQPMTVGGGITQPEADVYNAWLTNLSLSAGYSTALTTSLNREQGADTDGNSYWETAQMTAAVQFGAQLATLLDQEPVLRSNVVAQFAAGGFQPITFSTNDAIAMQMEISTNGLPQVLLDGLTALGTDPETITNIQISLLTADPDSLAGSFPGSLANTNLDATTHTLAADLRDASLMLINTGVLPGGQFRFDLPTEPGYTYSLQFTENLTQPTTWTTILTTNATTSLLSFTNTPAGGTAAGFYRATHN